MALIEFEDEDKYFVKFFLLDATLNLNNWGVTQQSLEANLDTFIGKPFVLTPEFNHPDASDGDNLLIEQERYRVGDIIKVGIEPRTGKAYGVAEITNQNAKDILKNGEVNFVSPSIVFSNNDELDIQGNAIIESWEGAHVAAVKDPAYTINKAQIKGKCAGNKGSCMNSLNKVEASLESFKRAKCNCKNADYPEDNFHQKDKSKNKDKEENKPKKKKNKTIPKQQFRDVVDFIDDFVGKNDEMPSVDHISSELNVPEDQAELVHKAFMSENFDEIEQQNEKRADMEVTTKNKKKITMPKKTKNSSHKLKKAKNSNNMKKLYAEVKDKDEANDDEENVKAEDMSNTEEKRYDDEMKKGRKAEDEDKEDEEAEDENKLDLTDRQEEYLKDKKDSSLRAQIKLLKSELKAMKANFRKAQIEPVIDSILEAKSKLGKINAEAEYNKLIRLDNETLESLKADYEKLSENISQPRFEVKYANVDSKAGDAILRRIRGDMS